MTPTFADVTAAAARIAPYAVRTPLVESWQLNAMTGGRIFLKLDTQGYDLRVIEGAGAKLAQIQALQTEVVVKSIYQGMVDYLEALKILQNNGFELTGMFPVTRDDRDQLRVVEMDAVMCRTEAAERIIKAG
jgi:hypothetical protein